MEIINYLIFLVNRLKVKTFCIIQNEIRLCSIKKTQPIHYKTSQSRTLKSCMLEILSIVIDFHQQPVHLFSEFKRTIYFLYITSNWMSNRFKSSVCV